MTRQRGFTLVEVLLSIAIIGVLSGLSLPIYNTFAVRNDLDLATQQVASALRRAQTYARGANGDVAWSVEVQSSSVILFKGTNFASRDSSFDEVVTLPGTASVSGLGEVQFSKLSGAPNTTGNIVLTSTSNDTRTITVNAKGMVSY